MKMEEVDLKRMVELGVQVSSLSGGTGFMFKIPWGLHESQYIEIGCLMSRLGEKTPIEIEFSESYPEYLKYRVYFREKGARNLLI